MNPALSIQYVTCSLAQWGGFTVSFFQGHTPRFTSWWASSGSGIQTQAHLRPSVPFIQFGATSDGTSVAVLQAPWLMAAVERIIYALLGAALGFGPLLDREIAKHFLMAEKGSQSQAVGLSLSQPTLHSLSPFSLLPSCQGYLFKYVPSKWACLAYGYK